ncbi:MAG TPA: hypothetical protein VH370_09070 [Humisphaera sp.]|jgi:Ca2+/Na+ antiporter|nr:hypothetical protein [Humisphaera sp.]
MALALSGGLSEGVLLLVAAALAHYSAARMGIFALSRADGADPGRRAIGQWIPIAATAIGALLMNEPKMALSVILGTSVASLALVPGLIAVVSSSNVLPASRRAWPFLLPAALLPMMAGFSAHLAWGHAIAMLLFGAMVLMVWLQDPGDETTSAPAIERSRSRYLVVVAMLLAVGGAYLAVKGTIFASNEIRVYSPPLVASIVLNPLLLMPTIGTASTLAQNGHSGRALSAMAATVLLNLCLLLPMVILLHVGLHSADKLKMIHTGNELLAQLAAAAMPYPMAAWRIDTVLLVLFGFAAIPVAMGRWVIGWLESGLLIFGYVAYLAFSVLAITKGYLPT